MVELEEISSEVTKLLRQYPPSGWVTSYFEGAGYGHLSSIIDEFNQWIVEARELPIIKVIEFIHSKSMANFEERRVKCWSWFSMLVPYAEHHIMESMNRASIYQVLQSDEIEFEVLSAERSEMVNIEKSSCSCHDWQLYGIPCSHGVAALLFSGKDAYSLIEEYFAVSNFCKAYAEEIHSITGKIRVEQGR